MLFANKNRAHVLTTAMAAALIHYRHSVLRNVEMLIEKGANYSRNGFSRVYI